MDPSRARAQSHEEPTAGALCSAPHGIATSRRPLRLAALAVAAVVPALGCGCANIAGIQDLSGEDLAAGAWSKRFGASGDQGLLQIVLGSGGALYLTGTFEGTIDFGGGALAGPGTAQRFLTGLDAARGRHRFSHALGDKSMDPVLLQRIAATDDGVVIAGGFSGKLALGNAVLTSDGADAFIAKLDGAGEVLWSWRLGDSQFQWAADVAVSSAGGVDFVGGYWGALWPDLPPSAGKADIFVAEYDGTGMDQVPERSTRFFTPDDEYALLLAEGPLQTTILVARFSGAVPVPATTPATAGGIFVAKLDGSWNPIWTHVLSTSPGTTFPAGVALDAEDNVIIAGSFGGPLDTTPPLMSSGGLDAFVIKLDPDGKELWSRRFGDGSNQAVSGLAVGRGGEIVLAGGFAGTLDLGAERLTSAGGGDAFLAGLGPGGETRWAQAFGGVGEQAARSVAIDPAGNLYVGGEFEGSIDLGQGPLMSVSHRDLFVAKLARGAK